MNTRLHVATAFESVRNTFPTAEKGLTRLIGQTPLMSSEELESLRARALEEAREYTDTQAALTDEERTQQMEAQQEFLANKIGSIVLVSNFGDIRSPFKRHRVARQVIDALANTDIRNAVDLNITSLNSGFSAHRMHQFATTTKDLDQAARRSGFLSTVSEPVMTHYDYGTDHAPKSGVPTRKVDFDILADTAAAFEADHTMAGHMYTVSTIEGNPLLEFQVPSPWRGYRANANFSQNDFRSGGVCVLSEVGDTFAENRWELVQPGITNA